MFNSLPKINLSKIGWEGGGSTSIWIMSLNILFFLDGTPKEGIQSSCIKCNCMWLDFNSTNHRPLSGDLATVPTNQ